MINVDVFGNLFTVIYIYLRYIVRCDMLMGFSEFGKCRMPDAYVKRSGIIELGVVNFCHFDIECGCLEFCVIQQVQLIQFNSVQFSLVNPVQCNSA